MAAYYNENEPFAVAWLRELIRKGLIADGTVDDRSITSVGPADLRDFTQCHFFAGIAGWSYALRLAGWPDDRPVWTGSCPCQPFSVAGQRRGFEDDRHLWPYLRGLVAERRPATFFGEQVASAANWLRLVRGDLEALGYAVGAIPIEAASAGADHKRDRYWFVADATTQDQRRRGVRRPGESESAAEQWAPGEFGGPRASSPVADTDDTGPQGWQLHAERAGECAAGPHGLEHGGWITCADGKARRLPQSSIRLLAHGVSARVGKLRGFGNAIDPRPAAAFIRAVM